MQRPPRRRARSSLLYSPAQDGSHIKWLPLRAELAMNFVPTAREGAPLLLEGLIIGYSMSGCIQSGTGFPDGRGLENRVPEFAFGMGCGFRLRALVDNATRNLRSEWDAVSQRGRKRKLHPTPDVNSGTRLPDTKKATRCGLRLIYVRRYTQDKPRPNIRASVQAEAYKVHREFRTQRRPLNVASVLRRTVRAGNLICLRLDRRFSYEFAASRYLILVVPGARLGSVSLASVWKCSVYTFLPSRNIS